MFGKSSQPTLNGPPHHVQSMASFRMTHPNLPSNNGGSGVSRSISSRFPVDATSSINSEHYLHQHTTGNNSNHHHHSSSIFNKPLAMIFKQDMNWFYDFKDITQRQLFSQFNRELSLTLFFQFYLFFVSVVLLPISIYLVVVASMGPSSSSVSSSSSPLNHFEDHNFGHHMDHQLHLVDFVCAILLLIYSMISFVCGWMLYFDHCWGSSSLMLNSIGHNPWISVTNKMSHLSAVVVPIAGEPDSHNPSLRRKSFFSFSGSSRVNQELGKFRHTVQRMVRPWLTAQFSSLASSGFLISTQLFYIFLLVKVVFLTFYNQDDATPTDTTCAMAYFVSICSCLLLFIPYMIYASLPEISMTMLWSVLSLSLTFVLAMEVAMLCPQAIPVSILSGISAACLIIDFQSKQLQLFLKPSLYSSPSSNSSSDGLLSSNNSNKSSKKMETNHANEMRHMIANVAHDLKTPLSSFITGMDYIQYIINDCQTHIINGNGGIAQLKDYIDNIQSCINGIRNTNSFMLMTINRCIDFAKASRGFKLVPKFDTIDLQETLQLPLECMRNLQDRIQIKLNPIDPAICSHIVTDKQWLQENILCLLSNAVKYSIKGTVTIDVMLTHDPLASVEPLGMNTYNNNNGISSSNVDEVVDFVQPIPSHSHYGHGHSDELAETSLKSCDSLSQHDTLRVSQKVLPVGTTVANRRGSLIVDSLPEDSEFFLTLHRKEKEAITRHNSENVRTQLKEDARELRQKAKEELNKITDQHLLVMIEDMGIGMSEEAMKELFSPFKQTQRLAGGTGLGLFSLAKRIEALQGKYGVTYRRDCEQGSLFWFSIPYKPDAITAGIAASIATTALSSTHAGVNVHESSDVPTGLKAIDTTGTFARPPEITLNHSWSEKTHVSIVDRALSGNVPRSLDILLVDDSPTIVKMTTMMLQKLGHRVTNAENGEAAIECVLQRNRLRGESFDLILMDLQMPVMDGLEATKRIRNYERGPAATPKLFKNPGSVSPVKGEHLLAKQKIIGMSANSDSEALQIASDYGMDMFVEKPFNAQSFQNIVEKLFTTSH